LVGGAPIGAGNFGHNAVIIGKKSSFGKKEASKRDRECICLENILTTPSLTGIF
jgi:hypothetical protein